MTKQVYTHIRSKFHAGQKQLAVLIDPDSVEDENELLTLCRLCEQHQADMILVGGSLITNGYFERCVHVIKQHVSIPVVLFPGSIMQISTEADAVLFLSLISGRNPDLLIGKHVLAAPQLKQSGIEVIPTGYMLIDGGRVTSVSYMSNTTPIPADKPSIAATTALAGELLGLKLMYMDAGSGAHQPIPASVIHAVRNQVSLPILVGGGIRSAEQAYDACAAGADIIVVGNAFEDNPDCMDQIAKTIHQYGKAGVHS